jgi:hypothetical protein
MPGVLGKMPQVWNKGADLLARFRDILSLVF